MAEKEQEIMFGKSEAFKGKELTCSICGKKGLIAEDAYIKAGLVGREGIIVYCGRHVPERAILNERLHPNDNIMKPWELFAFGILNSENAFTVLVEMQDGER